MSTNEQLAWDFDDGDVAEVRPDTGIARFAPGSEQWIAALQPTDDDAIRLDRFDVNTMTAEAAARLWARVAAWVESDQIAYYIDDSPVSSESKLRKLAEENPAAGWVIMNGNRIQIKRKKYKKMIDTIDTI